MLTHMELNIVGTVIFVRMTVYTLSYGYRRNQAVAINQFLVIASKVPLGNAEVLICNIRGRNKAIGDIPVYGIGRHVEVERLIRRPLPVLTGKYLNLY
jgi:hypothetical protein